MKSKYKYYISIEYNHSLDLDLYNQKLNQMRKWCYEFLGPKALKDPDPKLSVYWAKKRNMSKFSPNNDLHRNYGKIYDHENSRWMNKKNSAPNQFWFKNETDATAFRLMVDSEWPVSVKENKNYGNNKKI